MAPRPAVACDDQASAPLIAEVREGIGGVEKTKPIFQCTKVMSSNRSVFSAIRLLLAAAKRTHRYLLCRRLELGASVRLLGSCVGQVGGGYVFDGQAQRFKDCDFGVGRSGGGRVA